MEVKPIQGMVIFGAGRRAGSGNPCNNSDHTVGDFQGLVKILGGCDHVIHHLPRLVVLDGGSGKEVPGMQQITGQGCGHRGGFPYFP